MNVDQLRDAMAGADPSPGAVLDLVHRKRRAARTRMYAATSGLAVALAIIVIGVLARGVHPGAVRSTSAGGGALSGPASSLGAAAAGPSPRAANGTDGGQFGSASSSMACTQATLGPILARAVSSGASVIVGSATVAGSPAAGQVTSGGPVAYYPVTLRSVRTLAGRPVASGTVAWIAAAPASTSAPVTVAPPATEPAGQVFGLVYPSASGGAPGRVLLAAALVRGQVSFSLHGCWGTAALPAASPGLSPVVGSLAVTRIPLTVAEKIAAGR